MQQQFHGAATLCVAKEAGLDDETAKAIAWACWYVDETRLTQVKFPWTNMIWNNPGPAFHFADPGKIRQYLRKDIYLDDEIDIGIALHTLQDTYAHKGFFGYCTAKNNTQPWLQWYPHYGHCGEGHTPDNVDATWWDGRVQETIVNRARFSDALWETYKILGGKRHRPDFLVNSDADAILWDVSLDHDARGVEWLKAAGFPSLDFRAESKTMWKRYGKEFKAAAKRQREFLT